LESGVSFGKRENFPSRGFITNFRSCIFPSTLTTNPQELKMAATGNAQTEASTDASAGNTNRVWVGNLAYKSSEQELKEAFAGMKM
jgi:RNA recognition motif-containing protein